MSKTWRKEERERNRKKKPFFKEKRREEKHAFLKDFVRKDKDDNNKERNS